MKTRQLKFRSEGARDLGLVLLWTAALLVAGSAANFIAVLFEAGQW